MSDEEKSKPLPIKLQHISNFLEELESFYAKVESREIPESQAKVLLGIRKTQLQAVSLNLRYQQLMKWRNGSEDMPVLAKRNEEEADRKKVV
jgi:hypothetical protein